MWKIQIWITYIWGQYQFHIIRKITDTRWILLWYLLSWKQNYIYPRKIETVPQYSIKLYWLTFSPVHQTFFNLRIIYDTNIEKTKSSSLNLSQNITYIILFSDHREPTLDYFQHQFFHQRWQWSTIEFEHNEHETENSLSVSSSNWVKFDTSMFFPLFILDIYVYKYSNIFPCTSSKYVEYVHQTKT